MRLRDFVAFVGVAASLVHALPANGKNKGGKGKPDGASTSVGLPVDPSFNAEFTFEFKMEDYDGKGYMNSIAEFRKQKGALENGARFLAEASDPPQFFDVLLRTTGEGESFELPIKLQKDTLYLQAYKSDKGWKEVLDSNSVCKGKTEFAGDYTNLVRVAKYPKNKDGLQGRELTKVGKYQTREAIKTLLSASTVQEEARAFLVLTQTVPESIRIKQISKTIGEVWPHGGLIPPNIVDLENKWADTPAAQLGIAKRPVTCGNGKAKREICIPKLQFPENHNTGNGKQKPIAGSKPNLSELKAFGGKVPGAVGVLSTVVVGCVLSEPPEEKSKQLRKRIDVWKGFLNIPWTIWDGVSGGISDLFSPSNGEALKKSAGDGVEAIRELPGQIREQIPKIWSEENLKALEKSASEGLQALIDTPGQVVEQLPKAWGKENRDALTKSAGDFVKALRETPGLLECAMYDLREAAQDVVIALQKAPGQVASELQKFDRGLDGLGPNGKKAFLAMTGSLGVFAPSQYDEIAYMAPGICHIVNSINVPKLQKSSLPKCPLVVKTRFNRVGQIVKELFMSTKGAAGSSNKKAFWDKLDISVWGKLAYLEVEGFSDPSIRAQSNKAWETLLNAQMPSNLPEISDEDKIKLWRVIINREVHLMSNKTPKSPRGISN
ncbi:hypothetical protein AA313_de0207595 [Arthrobotrys entomopaga]|nr:hypothetical protein AA313_de0207595 [Arthrobotrys entomopaga]